MNTITKKNILVKEEIKQEIKCFYWATVILFISAFIYSCGLFLLNAFLPWNEISQKTYNGVSIFTIRIYIRKGLEFVSDISHLIFLIMMLSILWHLYLKNAIPKAITIIKKSFIIIFGVFICTFPFSLLNLTLIVDYIYPLINTLSTISLLIIIALILRCYMLAKVKKKI